MTIRELRIRNNLTQQELGEMIGVTQAAVNKWERQEVKLNKGHQDKIDSIFKLTRTKLRGTSFDLGVK